MEKLILEWYGTLESNLHFCLIYVHKGKEVDINTIFVDIDISFKMKHGMVLYDLKHIYFYFHTFLITILGGIFEVQVVKVHKTTLSTA